MSAIDPSVSPAEARRLTVHDAWRCWRARHDAAPLTPPPVPAEVEGDLDIRRALQEYPAEAVRWALLSASPSMPLVWTHEALQLALVDLSHLYEARATAALHLGSEPADKVAHALGATAAEVVALGGRLERNLTIALGREFDTAHALTHLANLATALNRFANHKQASRRGGPVVAAALVSLGHLPTDLGLLSQTVEEFRAQVARKRLPSRGLSPAQVQVLVDDRTAARASRDWAKADAVRASLDAAGIIVIDHPTGSEWRVRP